MVFTKGDSNRCRNAYEKILHDKLPSNVLNVHKKNKHISVGRCRHIAIVHGVALPPYELLSDAGFELDGVDECEWCVPNDCKRFAKKVAEEGFCFNNPCETCNRLFDDRTSATSTPPPYASSPSHTSSASASPRAAYPDAHSYSTEASEEAEEDVELLLASAGLVQSFLASEGLVAAASASAARHGLVPPMNEGAASRQQHYQRLDTADTEEEESILPLGGLPQLGELPLESLLLAHDALPGEEAAEEDDEDESSELSGETARPRPPLLTVAPVIQEGGEGEEQEQEFSLEEFMALAGGLNEEEEEPAAAAVTSSAAQAPQALRHVRSLVRQLSSQLRRPEDGGGVSAEGAAASLLDGDEFEHALGNNLSEPAATSGTKRVRLPDVIDTLATIDRGLAKVQKHAFRSGSEIGGKGYALLASQRRTVHLVKLRCERLLECLAGTRSSSSSSKARAPPPAPPPAAGLATRLAGAFGGWAGGVVSTRLPSRNPLNVATLPDGRRVLLMFVSPHGAPLDHKHEIYFLMKAGLLPSRPAPTAGGSFAHLREAMRLVNPHVLWFAGHGDARQPDGRGTLGFSSASGDAELFDPATVFSVIQPYLAVTSARGCLECVVLNGCNTGGREPPVPPYLGDLLKQSGCPSVMCWASRADDTACAHFGYGVAKALVRGAGGAEADGAPHGYDAAFKDGQMEVLSVRELHKASGVINQRFELCDPLDGTRVVQAGESPPEGATTPPRPYRVRTGREGAGRVAAGLPRHLESYRSRRGAARHGAARVGWGLLFFGALLVAAGALAAIAANSAPPPPAQPQPLVTVDEAGRLFLEPTALETLREAPSPVCVLSVAGPAGEGTSTLANAARDVLDPPAGTAAYEGGEGSAALSLSRWLGLQPPLDTSSRRVFGSGSNGPDGDATGGAVRGVWMMAASATQNETAVDGCGSVVLLDTAGITGALSGGAGAGGALGPPDMQAGATELAQSRLLSFLLLTSNRLVLNARRQPTTALLQRLATASATAIKMRPQSAPTTPTCPPSTALATASSGACYEASRGGGAANACVATLSTPPCSMEEDGSGGGSARAELVMVLRDSVAGRQLSEQAAFERWLPGQGGQLVDAAVSEKRLMQLPPPSQNDLEQLRRQQAASTDAEAGGATSGGQTAWAAKLSESARELTGGMRAGGWADGSGRADGAALASWMERIVGRLNANAIATAAGVQ